MDLFFRCKFSLIVKFLDLFSRKFSKFWTFFSDVKFFSLIVKILDLRLRVNSQNFGPFFRCKFFLVYCQNYGPFLHINSQNFGPFFICNIFLVNCQYFGPSLTRKFSKLWIFFSDVKLFSLIVKILDLLLRVNSQNFGPFFRGKIFLVDRQNFGPFLCVNSQNIGPSFTRKFSNFWTFISDVTFFL